MEWFRNGLPNFVMGEALRALLDQLVVEIRKKRPHLKKEKILFHVDNAPPHTSNISQAKKHEMTVW